jgi:hypothetical protein
MSIGEVRDGKSDVQPVPRRKVLNPKTVAQATTLILSVAAFLLSLLWLYRSHELEPLVTSVGIFAVIFGFFVDPWLEAKSRRRNIFTSLVVELYTNTNILSNRFFDPELDLSRGAITYPRLIYSTIERALSSGLFNENDGPLLSAMINARTAFEHFNNFMTMFELQSLLKPKEVYIQAHRELKNSDVFATAVTRIKELVGTICENYGNELDVQMPSTEGLSNQTSAGTPSASPG